MTEIRSEVGQRAAEAPTFQDVAAVVRASPFLDALFKLIVESVAATIINKPTQVPVSSGGSEKPPICAVRFSETATEFEQLLNVKQVAQILNVSRQWVKDHATRYEPRLKSIRVGKLLRFRPIDVREFIERWCRQSSGGNV